MQFLPRPLEQDPDALRVPFFHRNTDYDEFIFYHDGDFFSRDNIKAGMATLHPRGIHHGPHPKALANQHKKTQTDEYAVMLDGLNPIHVLPAGRTGGVEGILGVVESGPGRQVIIDPAATPPLQLYKILIGSVVPRPIAFVSSMSPEGKRNLAPFSFFNGICGDPPTVCFSTSFREPRKDTYVNVKTTGEFVVNIVERGDCRENESVFRRLSLWRG